MRDAAAARDARAGRPPSLDELTTRKAELEAEHAANEQVIEATFEQEAAAIDEAITQRVPAYSEAGGPAAKVRRKREALETRNRNIKREVERLTTWVTKAAHEDAEQRLAGHVREATKIRKAEGDLYREADALLTQLAELYYERFLPTVERMDALDTEVRSGDLLALVVDGGPGSDDWRSAVRTAVTPVPADFSAFAESIVAVKLNPDQEEYVPATEDAPTRTGIGEFVTSARPLVRPAGLSGRVQKRQSPNAPAMVVHPVDAKWSDPASSGVAGGRL